MSLQNVVDTSLLFVKQINARNPDGSLIAAQKVLTSDGAGGTYWASPAGFTASPSVNGMTFDGVPLVADSSNNYFRVLSGPGIGTSVDTGAKTVNIYSKSFQTIDVEGGNTVRSSSASPTLRLVGCNGIQLSSDPVVNTIYIRGSSAAAGAAGAAAGANAYSQVNVISNVRTITPGAVDSSNNIVLTASNTSDKLTIAGVGDVLLSTNVTRNAYYISISSFTSKGWHDLSGVGLPKSKCAVTTSGIIDIGGYRDLIIPGVTNMRIDVNIGLEHTTAGKFSTFLLSAASDPIGVPVVVNYLTPPTTPIGKITYFLTAEDFINTPDKLWVGHRGDSTNATTAIPLFGGIQVTLNNMD